MTTTHWSELTKLLQEVENLQSKLSPSSEEFNQKADRINKKAKTLGYKCNYYAMYNELVDSVHKRVINETLWLIEQVVDNLPPVKTNKNNKK